MRASLWHVIGAAAIEAAVMTGCSPISLPVGSETENPGPQTRVAGTAARTNAPPPSPTSTVEPFALELTPLPTETALPTLELPVAPQSLSGNQIWDGLPTYPAESRPDYFFRLHFDPSSWGLTSDQFGSPALAQRTIPNCVVSPAQGRGLPLSGSVDHVTRRIGLVSYEIGIASINGVRQFATYTGGDANVYTAFEVAFKDQADLCLGEAEKVLATLDSVPMSFATPVATP